METKTHKRRERSFMEKVLSILLSLIVIVTILPPTTVLSEAKGTMSVVMGTPTWSSTIDYSFKDAIVNGTNITSIMVSGTNYTGVMSVPYSSVPYETLKNTSGTTTMQTFVFNSGITSEQAQGFIRGIVFRFTPNAVVTITVDGNKTSLPQGASIIKLNPPDDVNNPHYYMYVNDIVPWHEAYNRAKAYNFMGMKGYLTTITSQAEDQVLTNISSLPAWAGATRLTKDSNSNVILDDDFINPLDKSNEGNVFYWACGPEAGGIFYGGKYSGGDSYGYTNWNTGEPNDYNDNENSLQVNYTFENTKAWNDLPEDYAAPELLSGYFVEFSKYDRGMDTTYSATQTGSSSYTMPASGPSPALANFLMFGSFDYNGERKGLMPIFSGVRLTLNTDYTIMYTGRNSTVYNSSDAPIYPGDYTINIILTSAGLQKAYVQNELSNDFTITKAPLTPNGIPNPSKSYDGNTYLPGGREVSFSGKVGNDDVGIAYTSAQFDNPDIGANKSVTVSGLSITGQQSGYYTLESNIFSVNNGQITEGIPGEVTNVMFDDKTSTYNGATQANVLGSLPTGVSRVTYSYQGIGGTAYEPTEAPPKNAGNYSVTAAFTMEPGYKQLEAITKNLTINKAEIVVSGITAEDKVYDGNKNATLVYNSANLAGKAPSDDLRVSATGTFVSKNHADNPVEVAIGDMKLTGDAASNYILSASGQQTVTSARIMKKAVNVSLSVKNKQYDGLNNAAFSEVPILEGVVSGDAVELINGTPTFSTVNAGNSILVNLTEFSLSGADSVNYSLIQPSGITADITNTYDATEGTDYTLNSKAWLNTAFVITAKPGYALSYSNTDTGNWLDKISVSEENKAGTINFYIRNLSTKAISNLKTESYKIDKTTPKGEIKVKESSISKVLNKLTFSRFFKDSIEVTVSGSDDLSGVASVQYIKTSSEINPEDLPKQSWIGSEDSSEKTFSATASDKFMVYGKIVDKAGNISYVNSEGVVVYKDSVRATEQISFVKLSEEAVAATVKLNGNTIAKISNGTTVLVKDRDYTVSDDSISFKARYLNSLAAGDYTLTIDYNPYGEEYVENSTNVAPVTTAISLKVLKAEQAKLAVTDVTTSDITYGDTFIIGNLGGNGDGKVAYYSTNTAVAVIEGNKVKIVGVGAFAITATKEASSDGVYNATSSTSSNYTTSRKELKITELTAKDRQYNGTDIVALNGGSLIGKVDSDDVNCIMPTMGTASSKDAGLRTVKIETPKLTGIKKENYYLSLPEVKVSIDRKDVIIAGASASDKVYDGKTLANLTSNGALSENYDGENLKITAGQANFLSKNVGKDIAVSFSGFTLSGTEAANYNLLKQPENTKANISKAPINIVPLSNQGKYYGEKDIELQYKYEGNVPLETPAFDNKLSRVSGETIGSYDILLGELSLKDNGAFLSRNYDIALDKEKVLFKVEEYTTDKVGALNPAQGKADWYTGQVTLTAPEGYEMSNSSALEGNSWSQNINLDSADGSDKSYEYYLKDKSTGAITTTAKKVLYKVDSHVPKIDKDEIKYETANDGELAAIGRFLSFGNFFKKSFRVTLKVSDVGDSNPYSINYIVKDTDGNELLKGSSKVDGKTATVELPLEGIKDKEVTIEVYAVDGAGNEGEKIILKGTTSNSDKWYVSDKTPTIDDFKLNDVVMNDGQEIKDVAAKVTAHIQDEGGIYKVSYKFDGFDNYVDITEGLGKSEKLTKEYNFSKQFNSSGEHYLELMVENNSGVTTVKKIHFNIKTPESAKKVTISANGSAYFEGDSIKVSELQYNVSGLSKDENVKDILDTSNVMAVIDDKIVTGDSIVLKKGTHTLSFNNISAKGYSVVYNKAELDVYEKLTISFKDNDGKELLKNAFAQKGQLLNIPEEPVKAGSAFVGWSTDKNGSKLWNFAYDTVNTNMNLYAVWSNKIYSVTIRTNNGIPDTIYSSVAYGKKLEKPQTPTLESASFEGWYQDSSLTKPWNFDTDTVKGNTTIYAKFTKNTYTVSFAPTGSETLKPITGIYYDQLVRPIPTKPEAKGKLFAGWYLDKELTEPFEFAFDTVKSNITLYPKWVDKTYTVFGGVTDANGNIMKETKVEIVKDKAVIAATKTDEHGLFRFVQVPKGSYSLRATDEKRNVVKNIVVEDKDLMELILTLPSSAVSVAPSKENSTKGISFDKLDKIFDFTKGNYLTVTEQKTLRNGGKVEVNVNAKDKQNMSPEKIKEVQNYISSLGKVSGELYNVEIEKLVYDNSGKVSKGYISETNEPITVKIKLTDSSKNKNNYQIIREHNGKMQVLTKKPVNGEYFELNGDEIIIHSEKFSTFAVAFDKHYAPMASWLFVFIPLGLLIALFYTKNRIKSSAKKGGES
ncbi:YDG domain-containing protein [Clostridium sp. C8-1-8]|uniref:YDG domain-containing protein n=1 Tax=Clostridium sp. C8-1-8 TaxID=2698831 RepID=UPI00136FE4F6|nr:YDG domain-containing protein [Clostridium sp. C8-1-8]